MGLRSFLSQPIKRKVFISFHQQDRIHVDQFVTDFSHLFTAKVLGANDNDEFIRSTNPDYVMSKIREKYLQDSSVTMVMMGSCTHSRRYVDWEIKSSLVRGTGLANGLIGIVIPSLNGSALLPARFNDNWNTTHTNCYGRYYRYPTSENDLTSWIEDAVNARTNRSQLIDNSRAMMGYNGVCSLHNITH